MASIAALAPAAAQAQAPLITGLGGPAGFGMGVLPPDDDGSSASIPLAPEFPSGLEFFGTRYTDLFVNNNGNVSFDLPLSAFTPMPFPVAAQPMIAPWWGDVDTRAPAPVDENRVYFHIEPGRFVATWFRVGYFDTHADLVNSVQLILTDESAAGAAGDFDVEFRYAHLEWTTGDASDGMGGLGGTPAQAGFDAGNLTDFFSLPGSLTAAVLDLERMSNVGMPGVWRFQIRSGAVTECGNARIEAGEACDDGNTMPGDGCSPRCEIELALGEPCFDDFECRSMFCTDGVCCNRACVGDCEFCASDGSCTPESAGVLCRDSFDLCDAFEFCDGVGGMCPPDGPEPDGTPCPDESICNGDEVCMAGSCTSGPLLDCDDFNPCTSDGCLDPSGCFNDVIPGCDFDAGLPDAGLPDAGFDAGFDAGAVDAGAIDAAVPDAGATDAGGMDAGAMDAALDPGTPHGSGITCAASPGRSGAPILGGLVLALMFTLRRRSRDR
ncbi:MAG: hypothetical protein H6719_06110 [Sandaracinaceae bacterium]|nr:hypothetical protein [Sandaracinaceae bacterium]